LFLGHNMRHFPVVLKMKDIIDSGIIGDIQAVWCRHFINYGGEAYFKDWHSQRQYTHGLLLQKGAHDIDVIHWLCGAYTTKTSAMGKLSIYDKCDKRQEDDKADFSKFGSPENWPPQDQQGMSPKIDIEDHSMMLMQLSNGIQASYMQCHYSADSCRNYTFIGTKGRLENIGDFGKCHINVYTNRLAAFDKPNQTFHLKEIDGSHGGSDPAILNEFINFLRFNKKTNTSPVAARMAVAAGICATDSLRSDGSLKRVPNLDPQLIQYFENGQQK
ncbi:MAG: gfo/Idh/MocA family oxidoreductase, partial [Lentisphaeraceae bacterium]|nr:gfo/Idh/MocA family oxidoreductase [Lentisphaeraceae bacterium]